MRLLSRKKHSAVNFSTALLSHFFIFYKADIFFYLLEIIIVKI